ncbi:MAG: PrsW family glutamic-type intramembrane protease [bacterium]
MIWIVIIAGSAVAPSAFLLWYIYSRDIHPEPKGFIAATFGLGAAVAVPVLIFVYSLQAAVATPPGVWSKAAYTAFLHAAIPEEGFKFLVLMTFCWFSRHFDEPFDGIVYGATASLGFATLENFLYVSQGGLWVAILRAFTAVPGHAFCGVVMGHFIGRAKFAETGRVRLTLLGLALATILHGLYDLFLLTGTIWALMALPVLIAEVVLGILLMRRMKLDGFIPPAVEPVPYPPYGYPAYGYPAYGYPAVPPQPDDGYPAGPVQPGAQPVEQPTAAGAAATAPQAQPVWPSAYPYAPQPWPPQPGSPHPQAWPPPQAGWPPPQGWPPQYPGAYPAAYPAYPPPGGGTSAGSVLKLVFGALAGTFGAVMVLGLIGLLAEHGKSESMPLGAAITLTVLGLGGLIGGVWLFASGMKRRRGWTPPPPSTT